METTFKNKDARYYYNWQKEQRQRKDLPDYCIKTLDRIKRNASTLDRKQKGSNGYYEIMSKLQEDKAKFCRQLKAFENEKRNQKKKESSVINIAHLTYPTWKKVIDPLGRTYTEIEHPHQLLDFICDAIVEGDGMYTPESLMNSKARVVMIGEEYYSWLDQTGKVDNVANQTEFMRTVTDEQAFEMLKKYHTDVTYRMGVFPAVIFYPNGFPRINRWKLSKDTKEKISTCLSHVFGEENVWFPGVVVNAEVLLDDENQFYELADRYFTGAPVSVYRYETQEYPVDMEYYNVEIVGIPFVTRYQHKTAVFNMYNALDYRDDGGKRSSLLEPGSVCFVRNDPEMDFCYRNNPLVAVPLDFYGIPEAIYRDLKTARNEIATTFCWGETVLIEEMVEEFSLECVEY